MTKSGWGLRSGVLGLLLVALACSRGQADARSAVAAAPQAPGATQAYGYAYENDPQNESMAEDEMPAPAPPPPAPPALVMAPIPGSPTLPETESAAGIPAAPSRTTGADTASATGLVATDAAGSAGKAPLLIYSATLTLAVFGVELALDAVERLARERRGYLVRRSDASITIRVPAEAFQEALDGVGALGDELHRDVSARDVTEEFADLLIRLRNSEVVRQRLEVLLARAAKVEEALAVERELERVTQDIEQLKGKLKLLGELVRFSTITVNFQPLPVEMLTRDRPLPFPWLERLGLSHLLSL